jgi:hypothetical protein
LDHFRPQLWKPLATNHFLSFAQAASWPPRRSPAFSTWRCIFPEQALEPPQVLSPFRRWYCLALLHVRHVTRPVMLSCRLYAANMHNCVSITKRKTVYEVWGRQCGDGWNDLVQPLEDELLRLGGTIRQIKEKFGCLCFHYALPSKVPEIERLAFARRVRQAEEASVRTCETCGRPGELACDDGFYLTACDACREAMRLRRNAHS